MKRYLLFAIIPLCLRAEEGEVKAPTYHAYFQGKIVELGIDKEDAKLFKKISPEDFDQAIEPCLPEQPKQNTETAEEEPPEEALTLDDLDNETKAVIFNCALKPLKETQEIKELQAQLKKKDLKAKEKEKIQKKLAALRAKNAGEQHQGLAKVFDPGSKSGSSQLPSVPSPLVGALSAELQGRGPASGRTIPPEGRVRGNEKSAQGRKSPLLPGHSTPARLKQEAQPIQPSASVPQPKVLPYERLAKLKIAALTGLSELPAMPNNLKMQLQHKALLAQRSLTTEKMLHELKNTNPNLTTIVNPHLAELNKIQSIPDSKERERQYHNWQVKADRDISTYANNLTTNDPTRKSYEESKIATQEFYRQWLLSQRAPDMRFAKEELPPQVTQDPRYANIRYFEVGSAQSKACGKETCRGIRQVYTDGTASFQSYDGKFQEIAAQDKQKGAFKQQIVSDAQGRPLEVTTTQLSRQGGKASEQIETRQKFSYDERGQTIAQTSDVKILNQDADANDPSRNWAVKRGRLNANGEIEITEVVFTDGSKQRKKSDHTFELLDSKGNSKGLAISGEDLFSASDRSRRRDASFQIAQEITNNTNETQSLARWMESRADFFKGKYTDMSMSTQSDGSVLMAFSKDGATYVEKAHFGPSKTLIVENEQGPKFEYLANGDRLVFAKVEKTGAFEDKTQFVVTRQSIGHDGQWTDREKEVRREVVKEKGGFLKDFAESANNVPVMGSVMRGAGAWGQATYHSIAASYQCPGAQMLREFGSDLGPTYELECVATRYKNPVVDQKTKQEIYEALGPKALQLLDASVQNQRREQAKNQGLGLSESTKNQYETYVNKPVTHEERLAALQQNFGAGSYGGQLIQEGTRMGGAKGAALGVAGGATQFAEGTAANLPLIFVPVALGNAPGLLKTLNMTGTATAIEAGNAALGVGLGVPMIPSAIHDTVDCIHSFASGNQADAYSHCASAATNVAFAAHFSKSLIEPILKPSQPQAAEPAPPSSPAGPEPKPPSIPRTPGEARSPETISGEIRTETSLPASVSAEKPTTRMIHLEMPSDPESAAQFRTTLAKHGIGEGLTIDVDVQRSGNKQTVRQAVIEVPKNTNVSELMRDLNSKGIKPPQEGTVANEYWKTAAQHEHASARGENFGSEHQVTQLGPETREARQAHKIEVIEAHPNLKAAQQVADRVLSQSPAQLSKLQPFQLEVLQQLQQGKIPEGYTDYDPLLLAQAMSQPPVPEAARPSAKRGGGEPSPAETYPEIPLVAAPPEIVASLGTGYGSISGSRSGRRPSTARRLSAAPREPPQVGAPEAAAKAPAESAPAVPDPDLKATLEIVPIRARLGPEQQRLAVIARQEGFGAALNSDGQGVLEVPRERSDAIRAKLAAAGVEVQSRSPAGDSDYWREVGPDGQPRQPGAEAVRVTASLPPNRRVPSETLQFRVASGGLPAQGTPTRSVSAATMPMGSGGWPKAPSASEPPTAKPQVVQPPPIPPEIAAQSESHPEKEPVVTPSPVEPPVQPSPASGLRALLGKVVDAVKPKKPAVAPLEDFGRTIAIRPAMEPGGEIAGARSESRGGKRAPLVVDWERDPALGGLYSDIVKPLDRPDQLSSDGGRENQILDKVFQHIKRAVPYDIKAHEAMKEAHIEDAGVDIMAGACIGRGGVCISQAVVTGAVLERLVKEGYLNGTVSVDRGPGHAWTRYQSSDGVDYILDVAQKDGVVRGDGATFAGSDKLKGLKYLDYAPKPEAAAKSAGEPPGRARETPMATPAAQPDKTPRLDFRNDNIAGFNMRRVRPEEPRTRIYKDGTPIRLWIGTKELDIYKLADLPPGSVSAVPVQDVGYVIIDPSNPQAGKGGQGMKALRDGESLEIGKATKAGQRLNLPDSVLDRHVKVTRHGDSVTIEALSQESQTLVGGGTDPK